MTLRVLEAPYLQASLTGRFEPAPGAILVADLTEGIPALAEAVLEHREHPWCPMVALLADQRVPAASLAAFEPVPGSIAVLHSVEYACLPWIARVLRAVRRRPSPPATTIALWVERRLARPGTASVLATCFGLGGDAVRPPRTLTRRVQALGPLEVRDWRGLARLAQILVGDDRRGGSLEIAAFEAGVDPRTLRRWLRLATELSWLEATAHVGWEWVVELTLRRYGYVGRNPLARVSGE